jgi:hypothetical protein
VSIEQSGKFTAEHLRRDVYLYVRQSSLKEVVNNSESPPGGSTLFAAGPSRWAGRTPRSAPHLQERAATWTTLAEVLDGLAAVPEAAGYAVGHGQPGGDQFVAQGVPLGAFVEGGQAGEEGRRVRRVVVAAPGRGRGRAGGRAGTAGRQVGEHAESLLSGLSRNPEISIRTCSDGLPGVAAAENWTDPEGRRQPG